MDSASGRWWLKVNSPGTAYEARLLTELSRTGSSLVPDSLSHPTKPWCLVADAGRSARDALLDADPGARIEFWTAVLAGYADLQRSAQPEALRSIGLPDLSAGALLDRFDEVMADRRWFAPDVAPELSGTDWEQRPGLPAAACRGCGQAGRWPPGDRAARRPARRQRVRPAETLSGSSTGVMRRWPIPSAPCWSPSMCWPPSCSAPGTTRLLDPVRDGYLEVWRTGGESAAELRRELDLAVRTGALARAAAWRRALGSPEAGQELDFADAVAHWMVRLAQALVTGPDARNAPRLWPVGEEVLAELGRLRASIDNMDAALVHLLAERFKITQQVGELKAAQRAAAGRPCTRGPADRPAPGAGRGRSAGPGVRREVPQLRGGRGGPAPRGTQ